MNRQFEEIISKKNIGVETLLPLRATKTSAGYDFYTPVDLEIKPQSKLLFWTDVKVKMNKGEFLLLDVRSSYGVDYDLMLANTVGIIDADYYNNQKNEGNIGICLRNLKPEMKLNGSKKVHISGYGDVEIPQIIDLKKDNTVFIPTGERVAQGIFVKYLKSQNCNSDKERQGGIGSTTQKK